VTYIAPVLVPALFQPALLAQPLSLKEGYKGAVASAVREPERQTVAMRTCRPRPAPIAGSAFAGFCFPSDVIVLAVHWYLRFGLSYRDVEELLADRGIEVDHVTI
jgi:hypothetical protein